MNCSDCKHFRQHYIRYRKGVYRWCNFGHCVYPRIKQRIRTTPACEHFALLEDEGTPRAAHRGMRGVAGAAKNRAKSGKNPCNHGQTMIYSP